MGGRAGLDLCPQEEAGGTSPHAQHLGPHLPPHSGWQEGCGEAAHRHTCLGVSGCRPRAGLMQLRGAAGGTVGSCGECACEQVIASPSSPHPRGVQTLTKPLCLTTVYLPTADLPSFCQNQDSEGRRCPAAGPRTRGCPPRPWWRWGMGGYSSVRRDGFAFLLCNQILKTRFTGLHSTMAFCYVPPEKFVSFCINNKVLKCIS